MKKKKPYNTFEILDTQVQTLSQILTIVLASSLIYFFVKNPEKINIFFDLMKLVHNFLN